jgi:DnaK suppressor protein
MTTPDTANARDESLTSALVAERVRASDLVRVLGEELDDIVGSVDHANNDDEHDPDGATNGYERAKATALLESARERVDQLDAAIARLDAGTYGLCASCGSAIGDERLEALPATESCIGCAS